MAPRNDATFLGLAGGQWLQMMVGAMVAAGGAFGGFQYGQGAQAQTLAEHDRKIGVLERNVEKIQQDIATIKETQAGQAAEASVNLFYIRQSLEELKRQQP